jgi:hypothetical protein
LRLLVVDGNRPAAAGRAWFSPLGRYLGGGTTIPSEGRWGAMSALVARAWEEAVDRGTPTLVTLGGAMATAGLQRIGFGAVGRVWHLVDRTTAELAWARIQRSARRAAQVPPSPEEAAGGRAPGRVGVESRSSCTGARRRVPSKAGRCARNHCVSWSFVA